MAVHPSGSSTARDRCWGTAREVGGQFAYPRLVDGARVPDPQGHEGATVGSGDNEMLAGASCEAGDAEVGGVGPGVGGRLGTRRDGHSRGRGLLDVGKRARHRDLDLASGRRAAPAEHADNPLGSVGCGGDHEVMSRVGSGEVGVLVVDDQDPFRRAMSTVVEETEGFAVVGVVASGEESVVAAAALRPDLVLMDVNLTGIDGIEAARRISAATAAPLVVLLSTYDEDDFDLSGCGAAAYISKSALSPERLLQVWSDRQPAG
jgi:CheY-like chemotaxis protein